MNKKNLTEEIMVSVHCSTFNHEQYIRKTIESFLMQKTTFKFEILIHDDASTDKTADIIREYVVKYPQIIKPIFQTENQYSKGIKVGTFNFERAKGKYIATCEGDDYWADSNKLQIQFDIMEKNPNISMTVHSAYVVDSKNKRLPKKIRPYQSDKIFTVEEIIEAGGGLFPSNSTMYRKNVFDKKPLFYIKSKVGDYPKSIFMALQGDVYYIDRLMSVYRVGANNSWTQRVFSSSSNAIKHYLDSITMLEQVNDYTNYKYKTVIDRRIKNLRFKILLKEENYDVIYSSEFREIVLSMNYLDRLKLRIKMLSKMMRQLIKVVK